MQKHPKLALIRRRAVITQAVFFALAALFVYSALAGLSLQWVSGVGITASIAFIWLRSLHRLIREMKRIGDRPLRDYLYDGYSPIDMIAYHLAEKWKL